MDINGNKWIIAMLPFFGQEKALVDGSGRVKLCPRFISDFISSGKGEIVLYSLPEGGIAVYPEESFLRMRRLDLDEAERTFNSILSRRNLRFFGAMIHSDKLSNQGRITIPHFMREVSGIIPNTEVLIVGIQIGVEIWSYEKWSLELEKIKKHSADKGEREMAYDLLGKS